jgi:hypothetical protein
MLFFQYWQEEKKRCRTLLLAHKVNRKEYNDLVNSEFGPSSGIVD